uniref:Nucleosome assembly protein 1-like 1 n=2 Tax=Parascaris univalens TaxID=6257 RepID=A0A915AXX5_PARUN
CCGSARAAVGVMADTKNLADLLKSNGYDGEGTNDFISTLPKSIKRRVQALKKLQLEGINVEAKFYERVHQLEREFAPVFDALHAKRKAIVTGEYEPTDEECNYPIINGLTDEEIKKMNDATSPEPSEGTKGIPDFWLNLLKSVDHLAEMVQEHDEPILKHLYDITVEIGTDPDSYSLLFHFTPNEYFKQPVLKKWYKLQLTPDEDDPFDFDGPMVVEAKGTEIEWNEGKNVTKKVIKKKQRKGSGAGRFITKTVKADSFFNFFDPPTIKTKAETNEDDEVDEDQELLRADFEIGQMIRDQIVPRAVLFYTGEATDEDDLFDDYDGEDEDEFQGDSEDGEDSEHDE